MLVLHARTAASAACLFVVSSGVDPSGAARGGVLLASGRLRSRVGGADLANQAGLVHLGVRVVLAVDDDPRCVGVARGCDMDTRGSSEIMRCGLQWCE